jgi:hypothetical protein
MSLEFSWRFRSQHAASAISCLVHEYGLAACANRLGIQPETVLIQPLIFLNVFPPMDLCRGSRSRLRYPLVLHSVKDAVVLGPHGLLHQRLVAPVRIRPTRVLVRKASSHYLPPRRLGTYFGRLSTCSAIVRSNICVPPGREREPRQHVCRTYNIHTRKACKAWKPCLRQTQHMPGRRRRAWIVFWRMRGASRPRRACASSQCPCP